MQALVPGVVEAFVMSRVDSVEAALAGTADDPLDDAEMLQAQLEVLPKIGAAQYGTIGPRLVKVLDERQRMYESALGAGSQHQVRVLEAQLAWLVRVCAAMVGGHYALETHIAIQGQRVVPQAVMGTNMQQVHRAPPRPRPRLVSHLNVQHGAHHRKLKCGSVLFLFVFAGRRAD